MVVISATEVGVRQNPEGLRATATYQLCSLKFYNGRLRELVTASGNQFAT